MGEMISVEEALSLVLSRSELLGSERVGILDAVGRVCAEDVASDIDVSPFTHSAMDGFAVRSESLEAASEQSPVRLKVIADEGAGSIFEGSIGEGECIRIMTGAPLPSDADSVVKYEIVDVIEGDGKSGSVVSFSSPSAPGANIREAGEEAHKGEIVMRRGDIVNTAGVGFLASCGATSIDVHRRPKVAILATGSELVDADTIPGPGKIRNSNGYAMSACVLRAGGIPTMLGMVEDTYEALSEAVTCAADNYDFVLTTGGAANGDYDFIKQVVRDAGQLFMTTVNMRPGKAQTFGLVSGTPVFGLPGNPAAAYCGFELLVRPMLRKMQGYTQFDRLIVKAKISKAQKNSDTRRIYLRCHLEQDASGELVAIPDRNQSSGSFGALQRANCLAMLPEGNHPIEEGDVVDCLVLDVPEEIAFL